MTTAPHFSICFFVILSIIKASYYASQFKCTRVTGWNTIAVVHHGQTSKSVLWVLVTLKNPEESSKP